MTTDPRFMPRLPTAAEAHSAAHPEVAAAQPPVEEPELATLPPKPKQKLGLEDFFNKDASQAQAYRDEDPSKETRTKRKVETVQVPTIDATGFYSARTAELAKQ